MIHCFTIGLRHLVLDVNSGSLHQVDSATLNVLQMMQEIYMAENKKAVGVNVSGLLDVPSVSAISTPSINKAIMLLINNNQLFSSINANDVTTHMENRNPVIKALCLHMAHECNLRCKYCFAGDGTYSKKDTDRGLMSLEVGKQALDFLIANSGNRRNLEVDFFGGEPMLNMDTVKNLVDYGRKREVESGKKFRFTLTTNGMLLNETVNGYINQNFDNVVVSLDGRPDVNNRMRTLHNGEGSYDHVYNKIKELAQSRNHENYYVRGTYTRFNMDFAEDVLFLADCGFKQISIEPVVAPAMADYSLKEEDLPRLFKEYEKLAIALLKREKGGKQVHFFHFEMDLDGGPCLAKRVTGCGAGSEYLAVTPSGQLYPCHQFVMDENFKLGDLQNGIKNKKIVAEFSKCHVFTKPECADCWAKYYCSGGCLATAHHINGNIQNPDKVSCDLQKKRIECALYMYTERFAEIQDNGG